MHASRLPHAIAVAALLTGCATIPLRGGTEPATNTVLVDEPPAAPGPALPVQPESGEAPDALLRAAAFMVANDGRLPGENWLVRDEWRPYGCRGALGGRRDLRTERDLRSVLSGFGAWSRPRLFTGVAFGADGPSLALGVGSCEAGIATGLSRRGELMGLHAIRAARDTSLLFTTGRANLPRAGEGGLVGAVIEHFVPPAGGRQGEERASKPRQGQPRSVSSPRGGD